MTKLNNVTKTILEILFNRHHMRYITRDEYTDTIEVWSERPEKTTMMENGKTMKQIVTTCHSCLAELSKTFFWITTSMPNRKI